MPEVTVELGKEGLRVEASAIAGPWMLDEPADAGGSDQGPKPTEAVFGALGACTAITLRLYSERKGWPLEGVKIKVIATLPEPKDPEGVRHFRQEVELLGPLDEAQRERLLVIAGKCPVHRILEGPNTFEEVLVTADGEVA